MDLTNSVELNPPVSIGQYDKGSMIEAARVGTLFVETYQSFKFKFENVYYAPNGSCNILPVSFLQYVNVQHKIEFFKAYLGIQKGPKV